MPAHESNNRSRRFGRRPRGVPNQRTSKGVRSVDVSHPHCTVRFVSGLPDLRGYVRDEPAPRTATVIVRGGRDTAEKLVAHAERVRRAFVLDGEPVLGLSVFAGLDDIGPASVDGILSGKLATYRVVHLASLRDLADAGFTVLPTFARPHMTIVLSTLDRVDALLATLGPAHDNPHYGEMVRRRRG